MIWKGFYRNSKEAFKRTMQYIYNNLKADFNKSAQEFFKDMEEYSKLKDDYMENYDVSKLNDLNERILKILERDDCCDPIK